MWEDKKNFNLEELSNNLDNIIKELNLKKPIYHKTTAYSHFGKYGLPYERLNKVSLIKKYIDINK